MGTHHMARRMPAVFTAIWIIVAAAALAGCVNADPVQNHAKTQVLAYIVGSDLETNDAMATADLKEIGDALGSADPSKLDIVVAFGGAKKDGWRGMRIATGEQLKQDAKDGVFGNGQYLYTDPSADMGSGSTLSRFLQEVKSSRTADRAILIIADHGNSYDGIGNDDITGNQLRMGDIDSALKNSQTRFDPIMFDACLMGSVEVGKTVQPYTGLMLGSEEIQRGSYEYTAIIDPLLQNPDTDARTIMQKVADVYVDRKSEGTGAGKVKTMSVIDVSKMPAVRDSLDELGAKLVPVAETDQGLHDLKSAYNDAVRLGITGGGKPTSVDLVSLLQNIKTKRPELAPDIEKTIGVVKSAVVYERHNEYSPAVYGISIATPDAMDLVKYNAYGDAVRVAPHWDEFFKKMIEVSQKEESATPVKMSAAEPSVPEGSAASAETAASEDMARKELDKKSASLGTLRFTDRGNGTFALNDPYRDASVYATYYIVNGSRALEIGAVPARAGPDGLYSIPAWDGRWYYITPEPRSASPLDPFLRLLGIATPGTQPFFVDLVYDDVTSGGLDKYDSWVQVTEKGDTTDAILSTFVNTSQGRIEMSLSPYSVTNDGSELFSRATDGFSNGSVVTSHAIGYDLATKNYGDYVLSRTTSTPGMTMNYALLPDGDYAAGLQAYYDEDNEVLAGQFQRISIRNGAVTSSRIGPLP